MLKRVGHSGTGGILQLLNPDEFYEARQGASGLAAMPLRIGGHIARMRLLSRAFCSSVAHLAGGENRTVRP